MERSLVTLRSQGITNDAARRYQRGKAPSLRTSNDARETRILEPERRRITEPAAMQYLSSGRLDVRETLEQFLGFLETAEGGELSSEVRMAVRKARNAIVFLLGRKFAAPVDVFSAIRRLRDALLASYGLFFETGIDLEMDIMPLLTTLNERLGENQITLKNTKTQELGKGIDWRGLWESHFRQQEIPPPIRERHDRRAAKAELSLEKRRAHEVLAPLSFVEIRALLASVNGNKDQSRLGTRWWECARLNLVISLERLKLIRNRKEYLYPQES